MGFKDQYFITAVCGCVVTFCTFGRVIYHYTHIYTHTNHQILNLAGKDYKIQEKENVTNKKIYVPSITFSIPIKTRKHKPWLLVFYYIVNVVTDTIN